MTQNPQFSSHSVRCRIEAKVPPPWRRLTLGASCKGKSAPPWRRLTLGASCKGKSAPPWRRLALVLSRLALGSMTIGVGGWHCAVTDLSHEAVREGTWLGWGTRADSIQGGELDQIDRGAVAVITHREQASSLCSGALISANVAMVARHCLTALPTDTVVCGSALGPNAGPGALEITTAVTSDHSLPDTVGASHSVRAIQLVPGGDDPCGFDVALLMLAAPVAAAEAIPLIPRATSPVPGESYSAIGYGKTCGDAASESCYLESGTRRRLDGLSVSCTSDCTGDFVATSEWRGDRGPCLGDSGGPALDASGQLIGIALRGRANETGDCVGPVYAVTDYWYEELVRVTREAAALDGVQAPAWAEVTNTMSVLDGGDDRSEASKIPGPSDAIADASLETSSTPDSTHPGEDRLDAQLTIGDAASEGAGHAVSNLFPEVQAESSTKLDASPDDPSANSDGLGDGFAGMTAGARSAPADSGCACSVSGGGTASVVSWMASVLMAILGLSRRLIHACKR